MPHNQPLYSLACLTSSSPENMCNPLIYPAAPFIHLAGLQLNFLQEPKGGKCELIT